MWITIFITVMIIILIIVINNIENIKELYENVGNGYATTYLKYCNSLDMTNCLKMQNCGYVITNNNNRCVPGDMNGPYDKKIKESNGYKWYHNDPYTRSLISNDTNYQDMDNNIFSTLS